MLVDMGDRKQASDAQAQLAAIVSSSGDAIISMTLEGIITSWNASAEEIYGYSAQEMLGKSIYTLIPPEGWDGEVVLLKQVASGEVVQNIEVSRLKKNDTDIFASITVSPMRDSQGNIIGVSKIARDITERQHILHQLQEREGTLALSLHAAHAGVWSWDIEGKRIVWDKQMERIHGLEPETFEGTYEAWRKTLHPEDINFAEQAIQDALSDSNPFNIEFRVVQPDGPIRHVLGQATVVRDDDGTPRKLIGVYIDITNRKQAEQEIRRLNTDLEQRVIERTREIALINQELEAFNYSVSHDLRTPLRALDGFSQAVLEDYGDIIDEEGKRYLERIRLASQRMSGLIDDLLKLSRVSRREMERANVKPGV